MRVVTLKCANCGKDFGSSQPMTYCSKSCAAKARAQREGVESAERMRESRWPVRGSIEALKEFRRAS